MYYTPQPYKCIKCGYEFSYSQSHTHPAPVLSREVETKHGKQDQSLPLCPSCYGKFLIEHIGIGYGTTNWSGISDYDKEKTK